MLDGDYGVDDSMAALYLATRPDVEIVGVGSVHGNAEAVVAARNAITTLDLAGLPHVPVAVGAGRPLAQPLDVRRSVHGDDGLGGAAPVLTGRERQPGAAPAAVQLVEKVRAHPGCTLLATGPLTNLALALLLDPGITEQVERVVAMGGTLDAPGNMGPYTEVNLGLDPEAADLVLTAPWPVTLVGLDVTMQVWLEAADLSRIRDHGTPRAEFVWSVLQGYLGYYRERYGRVGCPLHDPTAACIAVDPSLATYLDIPVRVERTGSVTRGMVVADRRPSRPVGADERPVRIAVNVDGRRVVETFLDGLLV